MSTKNKKLPGKGDYGELTAYMSKKQVYTKSQLVKFAMEKCHKDESAAVHTTVVMLSPRLTSNRGDCRGNISNPWGHIAYNEKLKRKDGEEQRFRIRHRPVELEPRTRNVLAVEAKKVKSSAKTQTKSKTKTKSKAKAKAK